MGKELSQKSRNRILVGVWVLVGIQAMAVIGFAIDHEARDPAIEALRQEPTSGAAIGGTLGFLIGTNLPALVALMGGITLWRHDKSKQSKRIIIAASVALAAGSMFAL